MRLSARFYALSLAFGVLSSPAWACGPFLFANNELDSLSLLEPSLVGGDLAPFYLYASPGFGQPSTYQQEVITLNPVPMSLEDSQTNPVWDDAPGNDPDWTQANAHEWQNYLRNQQGTNLSTAQVANALDGKGLPADAKPVDVAYFALLFSGLANSPALEKVATERARDRQLPFFLRERYAYLALRAVATGSGQQPTVLDLWAEFQPLFNQGGLVAGRALGWIASTLAQGDQAAIQQALADYLEIFERFPSLRVLAYSSLANFSDHAWSVWLAQKLTPTSREIALYVRFVLEDRDFSPETLQGLIDAQPDSVWALAAAFRMVQEVEREAGDERLLALTVAPQTWVSGPDSLPSDTAVVASMQKKGLYTALVNTLEAAGLRPGIHFPRAWMTLAAYLAFFDGDTARMQALYSNSLSFAPANEAQSHQSHLLKTLIEMLNQRQTSWNLNLQTHLISDLTWAKTLDSPGHNRGLYHSLVVLCAQKDLAMNNLAGAARAFSSLQTDTWDNPYRLRTDDDFWATSWGANDPINLLFDVLLAPSDLASWRKFLTEAPEERSPLDAFLTRPGWIEVSDLDYLEAYKELRQGHAQKALSLLQPLAQTNYFTGAKTWRGDASPFPVRPFAFSTTVDVVDPGSGSGIKPATLVELAQTMQRLESSKTVELGNFWFSLQLSGFPLIFSAPPQVISFVNNWQYYGYNGADTPNNDGSPAADFPLFQPRFASDFRSQLVKFQSDDFSATNHAIAAYRETTLHGSNPESRALAWAMIATLTNDRSVIVHLANPEFRQTSTYQNLRSNCETLRSFL